MAADIAKGFAVFAGVSAEIIRASAREAEARGFASFWVNHPGSVDGLGSLAQAAGPAIASMLIYVLMAVVLAIRPQGLFPVRHA